MLQVTTQKLSSSSAVEIAQHHHFSIFLLFAIGYLIHAGLQVDAVARARNNPLNSRFDIIGQNWIRLVARFFISLMLFLGLWHNPGMIPSALGYVGMYASPGLVAFITLPIVPWTSGIFGFCADTVLTYLPVLKNALPAVEATQASMALANAVRESGKSVVQANKTAAAVSEAQSSQKKD